MPSASPDQPLTEGYRLQRFELYNWGTFHGRVWKIEPAGNNSLLTGDIGSGKSTIVDALTTLLVPPRKLSYNRAAGAEAKERSLHSYVRGEYRSVSNEFTGVAQAQALRDERAYTVILGVFGDPVSSKQVTLAQVFWNKSGERVPARFYVVADQALSVTPEFTAFGDDIQQLRKRLRASPHVALFDSFEEYGNKLRRELGIPHAQALELFHQTISMKSVGNLTDFVRRHMLEEDDTEQRTRALLANFENLNRAHDAVIHARRQIELLDPLIADGQRLATVDVHISSLRGARDSLATWFARHRSELLRTKLDDLKLDMQKCELQLHSHATQVDELTRARADLHAAIERQGGGRIRELETAILHKSTDRDRQRSADEDYRRLCTALDIRAGATLDTFLNSIRIAQQRYADTDTDKKRVDNLVIDKAVELKTGMEQNNLLSEEIQSLEGRTSNIPVDNIRIRAALSEALQVPVDELPFVGEVLQVRPEEEAWEAAIERLLYGFALNLLVPETLAARVAHYVDRTHLRGRLVYLRARETPRRQTRTPALQAVARKLLIKDDSGFYTFLESELAEHFDHLCCDNLDEFQRLPKALTINGQQKSQDKRHEKDDRRPLGDRSRYVLGWDNRAKLRALRTQQAELRRRLVALNAERQQLDQDRSRSEQKLRAAERLTELQDFATIDWRSTVAAIQKLEDEKCAIEESDDLLRTLRTKLSALNDDYAAADLKRQQSSELRGSLNNRLAETEEQLQLAAVEADSLSTDQMSDIEPLLDQWRTQVLGTDTLQLRLLDAQQQRMRTALQAKIDAESSSASRLRERIVEQMQQYKAAYPADSVEMDARTEALSEYQQRLTLLRDDDLPRFERHFKDLLNKETINSMAAFQAHLQRRRHDIEDRIRTINTSLASIEYDRHQGTYVELVSLSSPDVAVRDFQSDLRACISGGGEGSADLYTEQKFLQVKALLERLSGREGQTEHDARWREKVTDVRNWFEFGAKERWRADNAEREFYRDSSGKSGGQKEKLAYTILAAALAYQFGLADTVVRKRHFRFVTIDEAFGRGSDDSTRYGLELFASLNLQLLIVTPLQKITVIEDYISAVHFVHNEDGANSMVQNLTIEEYRERRRQFLGDAPE